LGGVDGREKYGVAGGAAGADAVSAVDDVLSRGEEARGDTEALAGDEPGGKRVVGEGKEECGGMTDEGKGDALAMPLEEFQREMERRSASNKARATRP
jgi:hypothetical protein